MKNRKMNVSKYAVQPSRRWLVTLLCCCGAASAMAQGTDITDGVGADVAGFLSGFAQNHTWLTTTLLIIGALRVVFKPVMSLLDAFVKGNCTPDEYDRLRQFEAGPIYKWLSFGLDLVGSVKLPVIGIKPSQSADAAKN